MKVEVNCNMEFEGKNVEIGSLIDIDEETFKKYPAGWLIPIQENVLNVLKSSDKIVQDLKNELSNLKSEVIDLKKELEQTKIELGAKNVELKKKDEELMKLKMKK